MSLLAVAVTEQAAARLAAHLRAEGFDVEIAPPMDLEDGNPLDWRWLLNIPARDYVPAARSIWPLIESGESYLCPMTVYYVATSGYGKWVRVVLSPETTCAVVDVPEMRRAGTHNPLSAPVMEQARAAAEATGLRLRTPGLCNCAEENI